MSRLWRRRDGQIPLAVIIDVLVEALLDCLSAPATALYFPTPKIVRVC